MTDTESERDLKFLAPLGAPRRKPLPLTYVGIERLPKIEDHSRRSHSPDSNGSFSTMASARASELLDEETW